MSKVKDQIEKEERKEMDKLDRIYQESLFIKERISFLEGKLAGLLEVKKMLEE